MNLERSNSYKKIVTVSNQIEMYRIIIRMHSFLFNIYLSITQETILCYLCVHGISENTYKIILDEGIVSVDQILYNHISKLIKKGFVIKKGRNKYVLEDLKIKSITENSAYIIIKLNSKEKLEIKKHE
jgi:hypothetical protein